MLRSCDFLLVFAFAVCPILAFTTVHHDAVVKLPLAHLHQQHGRNNINRMMTTTSLGLAELTELEVPAEAMFARGEVIFWFFGASGAAGIARGAFPTMFGNYVALQKLKDVGPTKGGEMLGINPMLCGIPQDLSKADVQEVANNPLSVTQMVKKFPVEGTYLASMGYLTFEAFEQANPKANPLARRAIFDTFSAGAGVIDPNVAQRKLDLYKTDVGAFKFDLLKAKYLGLFAIVTLLFLLGIADIITFTDVYKGWFPEWPGGVSFPMSMLEPNGSPFSIPDYWI